MLALAGCSSEPAGQAPIVDLNSSASAGASAGGTYVVKAGDSLYAIARRNGVDPTSLQRANNLTDPNHLTVGQVLTLPGGNAAPAPMGVAPVAPAASSKPLEPVPLDQSANAGNAAPAQASQQPSAAQTAPASPSSSAPTRAADANLVNWGWPAQGAIVQKFSPPKNRGIDITGKVGDPVFAAADGTVAYAGNGIPGLGNLVIIQHANGFVTAYAHNQSFSVKRGAQVKRGTQIATIGQTDSPAPLLHFEIRKQGEPVDPMQYLPAR